MSSGNRSKDVGRTSGSLHSRRQGRFDNRKRPFVVATFAITVDGKVTTKNFGPVDFTSCEDKLHLFRQRASADAVLIGHTSLERDNVRLGLPADLQELRSKRGQGRAPIGRIICNNGRVDERLKIIKSHISAF